MCTQDGKLKISSQMYCIHSLLSISPPPFNPGIFGGRLGQKFLRNIPPDHVEYTTPHVFFGLPKDVGGGPPDAKLYPGYIRMYQVDIHRSS